MNLDVFAGVLCGITAFSVFYLHAASGPDRSSWISLPWYVRGGFVAAGVAMTLRAVDFFSIAGRNVDLGHINKFGVMSSASMAYLGFVCVVCVYRNRLRNGQWARIQEVEQTLKQAGVGMVPVAIPRNKAATVLRALGVGVNGEPPANPPDKR